ncbi:SEC14, partial [Symbiodinium pilosum]
ALFESLPADHVADAGYGLQLLDEGEESEELEKDSTVKDTVARIEAQVEDTAQASVCQPRNLRRPRKGSNESSSSQDSTPEPPAKRRRFLERISRPWRVARAAFSAVRAFGCGHRRR